MEYKKYQTTREVIIFHVLACVSIITRRRTLDALGVGGGIRFIATGTGLSERQCPKTAHSSRILPLAGRRYHRFCWLFAVRPRKSSRVADRSFTPVLYYTISIVYYYNIHTFPRFSVTFRAVTANPVIPRDTCTVSDRTRRYRKTAAADP